jgi:hypothetical protein
MNPREFLDLADELSVGAREVDWRTAASRAYYAAYHVALRLLRQLGFEVPRSDQAHAYLWLRLVHAGHPDVETAGNELNDLRRTRNVADYDLDREFPQPTGMGGVKDGLRIIEILEAVPSSPAVRDRITEAMKSYERDVLRHVTWRG